MTLRQVCQLLGLILLDGVNLLLHRGLPRRVLLCFNEGAQLPCAHQIQFLDEVVRRFIVMTLHHGHQSAGSSSSSAWVRFTRSFLGWRQSLAQWPMRPQL
jgi:hypothetical protein